MAYTVEFYARLKEDVAQKLTGILNTANKVKASLKDGFVDGIRSALPEQLSFIADKLEVLPVGALAAGGALVAVGSAAISMASDLADTALAMDKLATKTGTTVEFLSTFSEVAGDADVSAEQVALGLQTLSRNLAETGNTTATVEGELMALADLFATMPDGPQKTAIAMQAFGKAGADMIPILNQGSAALRENMDAMAQMGRVITSDTVAAANRFDDAMDAVAGRLEGLRNTIGGAVLPALADLIGAFDLVTSSVSVYGGALMQLISTGNITAATTAQLTAAYYDQLVAIASLTPSMFALKPALEVQRDAAYRNVDALTAMSGGARTASSAVAILGPAAMRSASQAKSAAGAFYDAAGIFHSGAMLIESARSVAINNAKEKAGAIAGTLNVLSSGYNRMYRNYANEQEAARQAVLNDTEAMRAQRIESIETEKSIDAINAQFEELQVSGGGGAAAIDEVTDSMKDLQAAQQEVGGMLGASLSEMDELARVQTAYALATGELSAEQFAQQQAVKALMQAVKDKQVSEDKAVTTAMALAQGLASVADVYAIAGPAGQKFADEQGKVQGAADAAATKVNELATAVKKIPNNWEVDVVATVIGMGTVQNAKKVLDDLHDRQYTAYVNVVYRQTGTPPPGGGGGGGRPNGGNDPEGSGAVGIANARAGSSYIVGENGPEVFTPNSDGKVVPNHRIKRASGGTPIVIQLDGRTIARTVAEHLK